MSWQCGLLTVCALVVGICALISALGNRRRIRRGPFIPYSHFPRDGVFTPTRRDRLK